MRHFDPNSPHRSMLGANCYGALHSHENEGVALVWLGGLGVVPCTRAAGSIPGGRRAGGSQSVLAPSKEEA